MRKLLGALAAAALLLTGCSAPATYDGYGHGECAPTTTNADGNKVTNCSWTEKPVPTVTQTVTAEPPATTAPPTTPPATTPAPTTTAPPAATVTKVNDTTFTYTGSWLTSTGAAMFNGDNHFANTTNNFWTKSFIGTKVQWYGEKGTALGIVAVSIDNGPEQNVDPYASARSEQNLLYTSPDLPDGTHTIKVRITGQKNAASSGIYASADRIDVTSGSGSTVIYPTTTPPATTQAPAPDPTPTQNPGPVVGGFSFAAVGDMNPDGNTSTTNDAGKVAAGVKKALADGSAQNFLGLGDFQYSIAYCSDYTNEWNKVWGPDAKTKTIWMAGPNHDVEVGRNDDLGKFMNGQCAGDTSRSAANVDLGRFQSALEWYSVDRGNWHILSAPTAVWRFNSTRAKAMTAEMDADLKAAKAAGKHLLAMYHDPYFTSNTSTHTRETAVKPWIDMFSANKVRVLLSGSQHNYERSCPVNNADQCMADGMQQFQVSTGGQPLRAFTSSPAYIQKRFSDTWGFLKMTLNADGSYSWQFVPTSGAMNTDSGTRAP